MTPQEKAEELVEKMFHTGSALYAERIRAKQCALIAVDQVLKAAFYASDEIYTYYLEVKQEIEKL